MAQFDGQALKSGQPSSLGTESVCSSVMVRVEKRVSLHLGFGCQLDGCVLMRSSLLGTGQSNRAAAESVQHQVVNRGDPLTSFIKGKLQVANLGVPLGQKEAAGDMVSGKPALRLRRNTSNWRSSHSCWAKAAVGVSRPIGSEGWRCQS